MAKKTLIAVLKALKAATPLKVRVLFRPLEEAAQKMVFGRQHMMVLGYSRPLPRLVLKKGMTIKTFQEFPDKQAWVGLVNGALGEWDLRTAEAFFFGEKHFAPWLCVFIFCDGKPAGTACGRIIEKKGKRTGEVHMVAVLPEVWGMGLGYAVTLDVLHRLRKSSAGDIVLRTDLWRAPAVKVYEKLGFTAI